VYGSRFWFDLGFYAEGVTDDLINVHNSRICAEVNAVELMS